jgi:SHS2 domain-containing protein
MNNAVTAGAAPAEGSHLPAATGSDVAVANVEPMAAGSSAEYSGKFENSGAKAAAPVKKSKTAVNSGEGKQDPMPKLEGGKDMAGKKVSRGGGDAMPKLAKEEIDVTDDINALVNGEDLSEEFKEKATTIFSAAVSSRIDEETKRLEESYAAQLNEQIDVIKEEMSSKVDSFLNYIVEQWINDNKLAINEHYMDIPEEKYDMVEGMSEKLDEMESKLNEQIDKNVELNSALGEFVKESIVAEVSQGLADTQKEKLSSLAEGVEFVSEESFKEKIETIKENYFPKTSINESVEESEPVAEKAIPAGMERYVSAISRYNK